MSALGSLVVSLALQHAQYTKGLNKADQESLRFAKRQQKRYDDIKRSAIGSVKGIVAAYAGLRGVQSLGRIADEYTKLTAQLRLSTRSQEEYNTAYANTIRISNAAQAAIEPVASLYARVSNATRELGANQQSVADITEATALALKVSGASAAESQSAILQLSQAFAGGRLRGEEFNAVSEASPRIMAALAKSLDVPIGALKEMASNGELTADIVGNALIDSLEDLRAEAEETKTIAGAFTAISNRVVLLVGELDKATGASDAFTEAISNEYALTTAENFLKAITLIGVTIARVFNEVLIPLKFVGKEIAALVTGGFDQMPGILAESRKELREMRKESDATIANIQKVGAAVAKSNSQAARLTAGAGASGGDDKALQAAAKRRANEAARAEKKRKAELLKDLQDQIKFEEEQAKTRRKLALREAAERKKLEEDAQKEKLRNMNLLQRAQNRRFDEERRQVEELARIRQRDIENYSRSITDALFRGFENGKGFLQNFKDTLINAFQTLILRPRVEAIISGSGIAGTVNDAVGALTSGASSGNLFGTVGKLFDQGSASIVGSIEKLGVLIANGNGGLADTIGGFLGANASAIGQIAPYANSIVQLFSGNIAGAAGSALGTAIGGSLGGPLGAAIGSFIGGKVFGGGRHSYNNFDSTQTFDNGALNRTSLGTNSRGNVPTNSLPAFDAVAKQFGATLGGLLTAFGREDRQDSRFQVKFGKQLQAIFEYELENGARGLIGKWVGANYGDTSEEAVRNFFDDILGEGLVQAIGASSLGDGVKSLFAGLTDQNQITQLANATIYLASKQSDLVEKFGITADQAARLAKQSGLTGDGLTKFISDLVQVAGPVESVAAKLTQFRQSITQSIGFLPATLSAYDDFIKNVDKSTQDGLAQTNALLANRAGFINFDSTIKTIQDNANKAVFDLQSSGVQRSLLQEQLTSAFENLDLAPPQSAADLLAIRDSIDYTTESGIELALALPSLASAFKETQTASEALFASLNANDFSTEVDFLRAQARQQNGLAVATGSSASPTVLSDGRSGVTIQTNNAPVVFDGQSTANTQLVNEVIQLRQENKAHAVAMIGLTQNMERILNEQERFGVLLANTDRLGNPVILQTKEVV